MPDFQVTFQTVNTKQIVPAGEGQTILEAAATAGVSLEGSCGGRGTCGKCRVRIEKGLRGSVTAAEEKHLSAAERGRGMALACQCRVTGDVTVLVPTMRSTATRKILGARKRVEVKPGVQKFHLHLLAPSLEDQRSDEQRLLEVLPVPLAAPIRLDMLASLPSTLRGSAWEVTAVIVENELLTVEPGDTTADLFGAAFDIGTTTVVGSLLDLRTGEVLAHAARTNEQNIFGADVISRIQHAITHPEGLQQLQNRVLAVMNNILEELVREAGISPLRIYEATAVGNTTMAHLLLGVDPAALAPSPFIPAFQQGRMVRARDLGLDIFPYGFLHVLPNVAGYVGSDTVAVMLAAGMDTGQAARLAVDIGTNGEMVLAVAQKMWTCSTAAGPAFEGAHIKCGMRAVVGAIERVTVEEGEIRLKVIGDAPAVGICGSGLIDAVAECLKAGVIDRTGRILPAGEQEGKLPPGILNRLRPGENGWDVVLAYGDGEVEDVVLTQKDVRELQLAKGAIRAGVQVLLQQAGIGADALEEVILAGAFGSYIRRGSALGIGLLPPVPVERVKSVGNAAGEGSLLALASVDERKRAERLARSVHHVELSTRQDFQEAFMESMYF